jgi:hypothetical protein
VSAPVLLFSVPVTGVSAGKNTFSVRAGTGIEGLASDFIVAPLEGGDPLVGGNYLSALAQLEVSPSSTNELAPFRVTLTRLLPADAGGWEIGYATVAGWDYYVQSRPNINTGSSWQSIPGGPFNSGKITLTNKAAGNFYRVQAQPANTGNLVPFRLTLTRLLSADLGRWEIDYPTVSRWNYYLQWRASMSSTSTWQNMAGGPFNTGKITLTNKAASGFYRIQAQQ